MILLFGQTLNLFGKAGPIQTDGDTIGYYEGE